MEVRLQVLERDVGLRQGRVLIHGRLQGRSALVTGSTHGIGTAIAATFAAAGAQVCVTGRDAVAGERVVTAIRDAGGEAWFIQADLADAASAELLVSRAADRFGGLDILVNNAAAVDELRRGSERPLHDMSMDVADDSLRVNLRAVMAVTQHALRRMLDGGRPSSVLNISSITALAGYPSMHAYTAAKGAILSLTRSLAAEYGVCQVRVNSLVVGFVPHADERDTHQPGTDADRQTVLDRQMLKRLGTPDDVARAALFLSCEEEAGFITGQALVIDGGVSVKGAISA